MNQQTRDVIKLVITAMAALAPVLAVFGIYFEWLTPEFLDNLEVLLGAVVAAGIALYGVWMNTYTRMKAFDKADEKREERHRDEKLMPPNKFKQ